MASAFRRKRRTTAFIRHFCVWYFNKFKLKLSLYRSRNRVWFCYVGALESMEGGDWSEWKQDCLASLLKILCFLGIMTEDTDCLSEQLYDVNEISRKKAKRRKFSNDKSPIPRLNEVTTAKT